MKTEDWKSIETAKALVIGHDPRLQTSETLAQYAFFADYYFRQPPTGSSERRKYGLAKATFDHIQYLTNGKTSDKSIYITNLCNSPLPHAPKGKTVLITESEAKIGYQNILKIINENPTIEYIFPMSLQVNYWLQKLGLYKSEDDFLILSEPNKIGLINNPPYFQPVTGRTFTMICGNVYKSNSGRQKIIPILHTKNYPLKGKFLGAYGPSYERIRNYF
jgi:hypothetical protein